jgi:hypothetical protein
MHGFVVDARFLPLRDSLSKVQFWIDYRTTGLKSTQ